MALIRRVQTIVEGVAGAPYYSNSYWNSSMSAQEAADRVADFWSIVDGIMVSEAQWHVDPTTLLLDDADGSITQAETVNGGTGQGAAAEEMLPPSQQMLVQWRTGLYVAGRELRGRTNVPALSITTNEDGVINPTYLTTMETDLGDWLEDDDDDPLVWSRTHGTSEEVTSLTVWNQFAVLRSRRD